MMSDMSILSNKKQFTSHSIQLHLSNNDMTHIHHPSNYPHSTLYNHCIQTRTISFLHSTPTSLSTIIVSHTTSGRGNNRRNGSNESQRGTKRGEKGIKLPWRITVFTNQSSINSLSFVSIELIAFSVKCRRRSKSKTQISCVPTRSLNGRRIERIPRRIRRELELMRMITKERSDGRSEEGRKLSENEQEMIQVDEERVCLKQYHVIQEGRRRMNEWWEKGMKRW